MQPLWIALAALLVAAWLWFLARGRASARVKRACLRLTLVGVLAALVLEGRSRGLFARSSVGFQVALGLALVVVLVGYLYTTRFCLSCGLMVRNLRIATCPRCGALLPRHGMTSVLRRPPAHTASGGGRDGPGLSP